MLPQKQSLVKYENPQLISRRSDDRIVKAGAQKTGSITDTKPQKITAGHERKEFEDILDVLLPPRKFHEGGKLYMQRVSRASATRNDILNLQEQLDQQLQQRDARELGLCPVRRELYDQLFDELMRQETIACPERGILLKRIRDDLRMTLAAYETLYESSIAFGVRKTLRAEKTKLDMKKRRDDLLKEKSKVDEHYNQLLSDIEQTRQRLQEEREELARQFGEEEELLAQANFQLKTQLETIIAPM